MEYCHFVNVDPETKQERMHHITPDFPYGADLCDLHIFPGNMFPCTGIGSWRSSICEGVL